MALTKQQQRLFGKIVRAITYTDTTIDHDDIVALINDGMVRYANPTVVTPTAGARMAYYIGREEGALGL